MNPQPGVGTAATAAPESLGPSPTPAPSGAAQWKAPIGLIIGIAVVVILIVLLLSFVLGGHGSSSLYAMLSSKSNQTLPKLSQIMGKHISEESQLNVSYSGNVIFNASGSGSLLGNLEATIPFRLSFEKNGNNTRSYLYATGVPLLGNITSYSIHLVNGTDFSCGSVQTSLFGKSSAAANITCQKGSKSTVGNLTSGIDSAPGGIFSNSTTLTVMGQREYNGNGCVMVGMHGSAGQNGTITKYNITMCISSQYYVPLNITGYLNEKQNQTVSFSFSMSATSIGAPVTVQGIAALPGPVENNTYSGFPPHYNGTGITTLNYTSGNYSSGGYAGNFTCTPASPEFNCTVSTNPVYTGPVYGFSDNKTTIMNGTFISFMLGQDSGSTWNNVAVAYVPKGTALNSSGIPEVPFNASDSVNWPQMSSGNGGSASTLFVNLPVSGVSNGEFSGSLWTKYSLNNSPGWEYTEVATVTGITT